MKNKLIRVCNNRKRYYYLSIYKTLFNTFCLERIYGSASNKKPTGEKREFFSSFDEAKQIFILIKNQKINKGYFLD